ncbi:MAG: hypothetical protein JRJ49_09750 [Deltaproteobacteria bacterium]|nr:hypothetical protein [Deltaproteobacteria bacterium]
MAFRAKRESFLISDIFIKPLEIFTQAAYNHVINYKKIIILLLKRE